MKVTSYITTPQSNELEFVLPERVVNGNNLLRQACGVLLDGVKTAYYRRPLPAEGGVMHDPSVIFAKWGGLALSLLGLCIGVISVIILVKMIRKARRYTHLREDVEPPMDIDDISIEMQSPSVLGRALE